MKIEFTFKSLCVIPWSWRYCKQMENKWDSNVIYAVIHTHYTHIREHTHTHDKNFKEKYGPLTVIPTKTSLNPSFVYNVPHTSDAPLLSTNYSKTRVQLLRMLWVCATTVCLSPVHSDTHKQTSVCREWNTNSSDTEIPMQIIHHKTPATQLISSPAIGVWISVCSTEYLSTWQTPISGNKTPA